MNSLERHKSACLAHLGEQAVLSTVFGKPVCCEKVNTFIQENKSALIQGFGTLSPKIPSSLNDLFNRVKQNPGSFVDWNKSRTFESHHDIRLVVENQNMRLILQFDQDKRIKRLFIYLMRGWNTLIDRGAHKIVRLGCKVSLLKKKSTLIALAKSSELDESSINELDSYEKLKYVKGLAKLHFFSLIFNSKTNRPHLLQMMRYYSQGTLEHAIMRAEMNIKCKIQIAIRLFEILIEVHARGISHNDLKTVNILMDENDQPFLIDFGHASRGNDYLKRGRGGTPGYFPAELCSVKLSRKHREKERKAGSAFWNLEKKRRLLEKSKYDDKNLINEIKKLEEVQSELDYQYGKVLRLLNTFCLLNSSVEYKIVPKKNDICALGFILEDLFGIGEFPEVDKLVTQMTDDLPRKRLSLEKGLEVMRKFESSSQEPQKTSVEQ